MKPKKTKTPLRAWDASDEPQRTRARTLSGSLRALARDERMGAAKIRFYQLEELADWAKQMETRLRNEAKLKDDHGLQSVGDIFRRALRRPKAGKRGAR